MHTCQHLKGLEVGSLPWGGACFLPSRPPSPKSRVPDHGVVLGCPPPTGPLVLWSELLFKRNFRPVSRSGSPSVHGVFAALPGGGRGGCRGLGRLAVRSQGPVTEETRAGKGGAVAVAAAPWPPGAAAGSCVWADGSRTGCDAGGVLSLTCWSTFRNGCFSILAR